MRIPLMLAFTLLFLPNAFGAESTKAITPEEAVTKVNEQVMAAMEVKSATLRGDVCFLNSAADFKDPKNLTVFIGKDALAKFKAAKIDDPAAKYKGKKIQAQGKVVLFKEHPELVVDGPDSITIDDDPPVKTKSR